MDAGQKRGSRGSISLDKSRPLNGKNPTSLRLEITGAAGGRVGAASDGFRGVPQRPRERPAEWMSRFERATGGIAVGKGKDMTCRFTRARARFRRPGDRFVGTKGRQRARLPKDRGIGPGWKKHAAALTASATDASARLVLAAADPGVVWLDMVSLFPRATYKGVPTACAPT